MADLLWISLPSTEIAALPSKRSPDLVLVPHLLTTTPGASFRGRLTPLMSQDLFELTGNAHLSPLRTINKYILKFDILWGSPPAGA